MNERINTADMHRRKLLNEFKWEEVRKRTLELLKKHNVDYIFVCEDGENITERKYNNDKKEKK